MKRTFVQCAEMRIGELGTRKRGDGTVAAGLKRPGELAGFAQNGRLLPMSMSFHPSPLDERERLVVRLRSEEGLTFSAIGAQIGVSGGRAGTIFNSERGLSPPDALTRATLPWRGGIARGASALKSEDYVPVGTCSAVLVR